MDDGFGYRNLQVRNSPFNCISFQISIELFRIPEYSGSSPAVGNFFHQVIRKLVQLLNFLNNVLCKLHLVYINVNKVSVEKDEIYR